MTDRSLRWCSVQPGTPLTKAFSTDVFRYWFSIMYDSHLHFSRLVNTLPTQDVRTMGWKFDGGLGSLLAFFFPADE